MRSALLALALALAACRDEEPACYGGEFLACSCNDGRDGFARCAEDDSGYGSCDCQSGVPGLTTVGSGGGSGGSGGAPLLPFLSPCELDEECVTGLCYDFMAKGPHCSQPCSVRAPCPRPSPGCNGMGICKVP